MLQIVVGLADRYYCAFSPQTIDQPMIIVGVWSRILRESGSLSAGFCLPKNLLAIDNIDFFDVQMPLWML